MPYVTEEMAKVAVKNRAYPYIFKIFPLLGLVGAIILILLGYIDTPHFINLGLIFVLWFVFGAAIPKLIRKK